MRVEQEDSQYVQRMIEQQLIYAQLMTQNELVFQDYFLDRLDLAGKRSSLGLSNGEYYLFDELR